MQPVDKSATIDLPALRTSLRTALAQSQGDPQLRRALIHAESVISDRLGQPRALPNRKTRRTE